MTTLLQPQAESEPEAALAADAESVRTGDSRGASPTGFAALCGERWWFRAALALLFALYVRTIGFNPVYDDNVISPWTSLRDVPGFFTHDVWNFDGRAGSVYYRPLAQTWALVVTIITGGAPGWLHLSAILLHLAVVALAYAFGRRLFNDARLALLTALLFGLHPSKVESVVWISSSGMDGLGAVFFFASLIAFLKWEEKRGSAAALWLSASVILFAGVLLTKETMVFMPILIAVYLWLNGPEAGRTWRILRTLVPYGVVWAAYMAMRHKVIKPAAVGAEYIHPTFTLSNLWTAPYSIWWYLRHLVMPWGLAVEYTPVVIDHPTLRNFFLPAAGLAVLSLAAWCLWRRQRSAVAVFLGVWFVINLAPPVMVAPMVSQHDRYLYISAYAFCALLAWAILNLGRLQNKGRLVVALCVVALWSGLTWREMGYWDCDKSLWSRVLEISPSQPKAILETAATYDAEGNTAKALRVLDDAMVYYPNSPKLWLERGVILFGHERLDEARAAYMKAMQFTEPPAGMPVKAGLHTEVRAAAAYQLARMDLAAKNFTGAERYARTAISLRYDGVGYHSALSESLLGEGRMDEAKSENALELRLRLAQQRANGTVPASVRE